VKSILVNGRFFSIAKNLHGALQQLQDNYDEFHNLWMDSSQRPIRIWIDAIYIRQSDAEERSQQVQLMKQIFEQAQRVVTWLGPSDQQSEIAFRKLVQLRTWYDHKA
jgi:Heterokaryon incompatibility protein (HET)